MPHDSKGQALQAGDRVTLQADVLRVFRDSPDNDSCNVEMQIVGGASFQPVLTCSAGLATKVAE